MIRSMTGFGRGEASVGAFRAWAEVRSVNHRFLAVKARLPNRDLALEPLVEQEVRRVVRRGSVEVRVGVRSEKALAEPRLDADLARRWLRGVRSLARDLKLPEEADLFELLALPGVVALDEPDTVPPQEARAVRLAVREALERLLEARSAEGRRLERALLRELAAVERLAGRIARRAAGQPALHLERLRRRLERLLPERQGLDETQLEREAALLADRLDVTEEIDRLFSHVEGFKALLGRRGPVGRSLEFLVQEMGREANTIGQKTQDARQARWVVDLKSAVERLREQVQNVE